MGESRKTMLLHIQTWIEQAIKALEEYKGNSSHYDLIIKDLAAVITGLEHLSKTYSDDPDTISQLRTYIDNIQLQIRKPIGASAQPPIPPVRHPTTTLIWDGKNDKLDKSFKNEST